jgi:hypothetical protein
MSDSVGPEGGTGPAEGIGDGLEGQTTGAESANDSFHSFEPGGETADNPGPVQENASENEGGSDLQSGQAESFDSFEPGKKDGDNPDPAPENEGGSDLQSGQAESFDSFEPGKDKTTSEQSDARKAEIPEGVEMKASELSKWAESQGWRLEQTETGPAKYIDENGVKRMTLKQGSDRAPGSENPHVEFRDASGQRIDINGNPVNRRSPENHTLIEWDL